MRPAEPQGLGLVELLAVLAAAVLLLAIALPNAGDQRRREGRREAHAALLAIAQAQEVHRLQAPRYAGRLDLLGLAPHSPGGRYALSLDEADGQGFSAWATALGPQQDDRACRRLSLRGGQGRLETAPAGCWPR